MSKANPCSWPAEAITFSDSEGVEGKFYVWTQDEIEEVLGQEDVGKG